MGSRLVSMTYPSRCQPITLLTCESSENRLACPPRAARCAYRSGEVQHCIRNLVTIGTKSSLMNMWSSFGPAYLCAGLARPSRLVYVRDSQVRNAINQVLPQFSLDWSAAKCSFPLLVLDERCLLSHRAISLAFQQGERARPCTAETSSKRKSSPRPLQDQPGSRATHSGLSVISKTILFTPRP